MDRSEPHQIGSTRPVVLKHSEQRSAHSGDHLLTIGPDDQQAEIAAPQAAAYTATSSKPSSETVLLHPSSLPWSLDRLVVVVLSHPIDGISGSDTALDGENRQRCTGSSSSAMTTNLQTSTASGGKNLREPSNSCVRVAGQAKIPPLDPLTRPRHGGWGLRKEIDTDRRVRPCRETSTKSASAHTHTIRELHDTVDDRPQINAHPLILASSEPTTARS